jgi:hypothetical protein
MPRWALYQACSAAGSFALKKIPPVTRFIVCSKDVSSVRAPERRKCGIEDGGKTCFDGMPERLVQAAPTEAPELPFALKRFETAAGISSYAAHRGTNR